MPAIVIVLMFLVAFLLAVLAMILAPLLGLVGHALWNRGSQSLPENPVRTFANARLQPSGSNDSRYGLK